MKTLFRNRPVSRLETMRARIIELEHQLSELQLSGNEACLAGYIEAREQACRICKTLGLDQACTAIEAMQRGDKT